MVIGVDGLLEREPALAVLDAATSGAAAGRGSVVLVSGEAGIGKSALVRAWSVRAGDRVRVLWGACDDLVTARAFGPLRDACCGTGGRLEATLAEGTGEAVFEAVLGELQGGGTTALVVEDLHWADDATLDVLGYLARRIADLPAVLVVTIREGAVPQRHPVHRWLGSLAGCPVHRVALRPLSDAAVDALAAGSGWHPAALAELTGGNPFFVTEVLAGRDAVPASVADAVMSRVAQLGERCRADLLQLSVVPGTVPFELADALLGEHLEALAEAEVRGMLEVRLDGVAFRHELARRAVEASLTGLHRRRLHQAVLAALQRLPVPDLARLVHHATAAGDVDAVLRFAVRAGREAAAAGSHRQALAHFEAAVAHLGRLEPRERAALLDDHAWELHNAHRFADALRAGAAAVALYAELDEQVGLGEARVRLSRYHYLAGHTGDAQVVARQAVDGLRGARSPAATAYALTYHGAALALGGDTTTATAVLDEAQAAAERSGRDDLAALCLNYQSIARPGLTGAARIALVRESLERALAGGHHEAAARGYTNLAELLYRYGRLAELDECVRDGLDFTAGRGFWSHAYNLTVHRCLLQLRRGEWDAAGEGLAALVDRDEDPGMLRLYAEPAHGRLLARRGDPAAADVLTAAWERGRRQGSVLGLAYTGTALVEWAFLNGRPDVATAVLDEWRRHADRPTAEPAWAELLRYAQRAGVPVAALMVTVPEGCPEPWASALRGDWRAAAQAFEAAGDPYEAALERAGSGVVEPTLQAVHALDDLGAAPAATAARRRLRALGVRTIPRGPLAATRAHPAGLTSRQADVLDLLAEGLTNAEIAERLVVSVRTVDHHVSTILGKLGVPSRRHASRVARTLASA
ncbi:AAA family ATPase [Pseudonocardia sp. DSM 110487]|uniref:LuxR family transcriptional regulator n=1 Tax=Pseudonocardia sp. DSM 110487 TaxID=2865833 RepID=UPI001C696F82|nr:LuxR family transcriptional regulator [Pseudonocardia sp. DSM 110487]QYN32330.1 AAA family ATPase [Pseudonocardia sp. DSM 110487]